MISRMTLVGALVVVELGIVGMAAEAISGDSARTHWSFGPHWGHPPPPRVSRIDKTFETGTAPHVVLDVDKADVTIQAGSAAVVHVAGTMQVSGYTSGAEPALTAIRTADGVRVAAESGLVRVRFGRLTRELRLTVPPDAQVEIVGAGSVVARGLHAKLVAHVDNADVRVFNHRGDVDVKTSSGDVELLDVQGATLAVHTDDGALKLTSSGADFIDARSASGDITAVDLRAVNGALITQDGHLSVSFTGTSDATVNVHAGDGDVHVAGLSSTDNEDHRSVVHVGSGRGHFEVSSGSGSITVTQGASV
jgi:hypothetical protein